MKKYLIGLLLSGLFLSSQSPKVFGQASDKILFGGINLSKSTGRYNAIDYGAGVSGRLQYPLTSKIALTAKIGLEVNRINDYFLMPASYLGYGYNPISGFGFNTPYYYVNGYEYKATAINIPVHFGPRLYVTDYIHTDLNLGVDITPSRSSVSVLRVEPGVGYMLPMGNGGYLDINLSYFTSFARSSSTFSLGFAYGLKLNQ